MKEDRRGESKIGSVQVRLDDVRLHLHKAGCQNNGIKGGLDLQNISLKGQIVNGLSFAGYMWSLSYLLLCYLKIL
jgi:hypothetical protein